jgi:hypothetical protein
MNELILKAKAMYDTGEMTFPNKETEMEFKNSMDRIVILSDGSVDMNSTDGIVRAFALTFA